MAWFFYAYWQFVGEPHFVAEVSLPGLRERGKKPRLLWGGLMVAAEVCYPCLWERGKIP